MGIFVLILLSAGVPAGAAVRTWDGGGADSEWATTENWDPDGYSDTDNLTVLSGTPTSAVNVVADNSGSITLDGSSAVANFSLDTYIGYTAGESLLEVLNGANLTDGYGRLGFYDGTSGKATISGAGSKWTNSGDIYVGGGWSSVSGTGEMTIAAGGFVSSDHGWLGYSNDSSGAVTVSGVGSKWTLCERLDVGRKGTGTLIITDGGVVSRGDAHLGRYRRSSGTATVSGAGSEWRTWYLYVGNSGTGTLTIINGGTVSSGTGRVGYSSGSSGAVTVSGTGSYWTSGGTLFLGGGPSSSTGGTGTLTITDGGAVSSGDAACVGYSSGSSGAVTVSGVGSEWNSGRLYLGGGPSSSTGGTGTLIITDGGTVPCLYSYVGYSSGSSGTVTVSGAGSTWTNRGPLYIGRLGTGEMTITDSGSVSNTFGYLGHYAVASGTVTVSGSGSTWTNSSSIHVGNYGQGTLNITNGGSVNVTSNTWVAREDGAAGEIHFDGGTLTTGSLLAGATQLTGTGTINTHGLVSDVDLLFDSTHGPNQTLTLNSQTGQNITINLTQDSTGYLGAGYAGEGTLAILDGVLVESYISYIGYKAGATGVVTVDGSGSTWTNRSNLYVGYSGQGTLNITNGGSVSNILGYIGYKAGATGVVTVDGNGSTWTCDGRLDIGRYGQCTLNISNGGAVSNTSGYIGNSSTGVVTVDGSGSTWTNRDDFYVGCSGQGTLNITNGGSVSNSYGRIGSNSGSTGVVTVDGSGSTWTNRDDLYVGYSGQGTLNITNGGRVSVAGTLTIDYDENGDGFINMATGGMLALYGDADDSLTDFLDLIGGTNAIRYWDGSASDWADITGATYGEDYTLAYLTEGDLAGYTVLTVPEPASATLLLLGAIAVLRRRKK